MARLLWLADALRAEGLQVVEVSGWRTRGSDSFNPRGLIAHATAGSRAATDQGELNVILNGSSSAPPPISQLMLGRTGVWYVVASGRCNHARVGTAGRLKGLGNTNLLGIEGCNDNRGEPWNSYGEYVRGVRAICRHAGWEPQRLVSGHKEHQPGEKTDPTFDMNKFRADVAGGATPQGEDVTPEEQFTIVTAVQTGTTPNGFQAAVAPTWAHPSANWSNQAVEERLTARLDALAARPSGTVVLSEQDKADLVAAFTGIAEAAAEKAVRKVLGEVDGR